MCEIKRRYKHGNEEDYKSQCKQSTACLQHSNDLLDEEYCEAQGYGAGQKVCYTCNTNENPEEAQCVTGYMFILAHCFLHPLRSDQSKSQACLGSY